MKLLTLTSALGAAAGLALAGPGAAHADALSSPSMTPPLSANPNPYSVSIPDFGKVYVTGQVSGVALGQDNSIAGDKGSRFDFSNAQIEIQKADGVFQFYVQAGTYSLPSLGAGYLTNDLAREDTFKTAPLAYVKLQPTAEFSIMAGKLPTLIGAEYTFTFQNMNIARGLLWNQEPAISRGVQANYSKGPLTVSLSVNDGYYSNKWSTVSGLISYAATKSDTVAFAASGNTKHTATSTFATPIAQNNGSIYNLIWTHTAGQLMVTPYLQYSTTPKIPELGLAGSASTFGGAVLAKYNFTPKFSIAGRAEYETSHGSEVSLLYGPKSKAWSLTVTPTYQQGVWFLRGEASYTKLENAAPGAAFGKDGMHDSQGRVMAELGALF